MKRRGSIDDYADILLMTPVMILILFVVYAGVNTQTNTASQQAQQSIQDQNAQYTAMAALNTETSNGTLKNVVTQAYTEGDIAQAHSSMKNVLTQVKQGDWYWAFNEDIETTNEENEIPPAFREATGVELHTETDTVEVKVWWEP